MAGSRSTSAFIASWFLAMKTTLESKSGRMVPATVPAAPAPVSSLVPAGGLPDALAWSMRPEQRFGVEPNDSQAFGIAEVQDPSDQAEQTVDLRHVQAEFNSSYFFMINACPVGTLIIFSWSA